MNENLLKYYENDEFAASVWEGKYAIKSSPGSNVRRGEMTPKDMHERMAKEFGRIESNYSKGYSQSDIDKLSSFGQIFYKQLNDMSTHPIAVYLSYMDRYKYIIPQGSIMSMLGNRNVIGSLSNCFVIPPPVDSYGGIFKTDQQIAQLEKRRGGVGTNLNTLRPEDTPVLNAAGTSTGSHSFMDRYSNTTREVAQNGRRGALMLLMSCLHPDIFKFVGKKADLTKVTGANISVMLTDKFMEAVSEDDDFLCSFPIDIGLDYEREKSSIMGRLEYNQLSSVHLSGDKKYGKYADSWVKIMRIRAKELYDLIVDMAWNNGEPGVAFMDRVINYCPEGVYPDMKPIASNPCGEQWMQAYDACRLLALNFFNIVENHFLENATINYDRLYEIAYVQQRMADNIVDLEVEHVDRIIEKIKSDPEAGDVKATELDLWENVKKTAIASRRTGCGFTGMADMLAALNLKYDSKEALGVIEMVMRTKMRAELDCTIDLSVLRGSFIDVDTLTSMEFDVKDGKVVGVNDFMKMVCQEFPEQAKRMFRYGRRNASWSTVAPTGTVSIVALLKKYANMSAGVEPQFALYYYRNKKVNPSDKNARVDFVDQNGDSWMTYPIVMGGLKEWIEATKPKLAYIGIDNISKDAMEELFKQSPYYGSTANDIDWEKRLEIQAVVQKYTTNAISSTLNLPKDVKKEVVGEIYMRAWKLGLKGVTVYRDGCRTGVLTTEVKKDSFEYKDAVKRPKELECQIFTTVAKGTKWNVVVGLLNDNPYEVFAIPHITNDTEGILKKMGKGRYDILKDGKVVAEDVTSEMKDEECVVTRMISTALRHGCSVNFIVDQLNKSHGTVISFSKAIARTLSKYVKKEELGEACSECGSHTLVKQEGCIKCTTCGHSKCG